MIYNGLDRGLKDGLLQGEKLEGGIGIGVGLAIDAGDTVRYCPEAVLLFSKMTAQPSKKCAKALNRLLLDLKFGAVLPYIDVLQIYKQDYQQGANLNIVNPLTFTATNVGAAWSSTGGYTGDGASTYVNTNFQQNSGKRTQNSNSFGVWVNTTGSSGIDCGISNTCEIHVSNGGVGYTRCSNSGGYHDAAASPGRTGFFLNNRTDSSNWINYLNASNTGGNPIPSIVSVALSSSKYYVCGMNSGGSVGSPVTRQQSLFYAGQGLTLPLIKNLNEAIYRYMNSML